ncbi:MAG: gamma-glutamyltransferase [Legionella sp.]|nr:gamma-glutamyltransferase [Legionella sp.]
MIDSLKHSVGALLGYGLFYIASSWGASSLPPGYAVATANPLATNAALEILNAGGNAFDAGIAAAAVLAVVEPYHSGLGGGSFWLLHHEQARENIFLDAREVAPASAYATMYQDEQGKVIPDASLDGGKAAAIPGHPAALVYLAQHYGRLPLHKSLAPAIALARDGFLIDKQLHHFLRMSGRTEALKKYPATAAIFLKNNKPRSLGERLYQKDLARTLELLASKGRAGFYHGEIARKLVAGVNAAGGEWHLEDLAKYQVKIREPLIGAFHNMLIITAPPPSAGGVALLTMLNILAHHPLTELPKITWIHYIIESMRLAYWQRDQYLGDPDFVTIPLEFLLSAKNATQLNSLIPENKAISSAVLQGGASQSTRNNNTTHISIIDAEGNRVAATMTVNYIFGSSVVAPGTGVLLNDEMDDFTSKIGSQNVFGLVGSAQNAIAPGKRPLSTMTPTFLETPERVAILGTPGGSRIATMVLLASLVFQEDFGAITMVSTMRFHHQFLPDIVQFEPDTFSVSIQDSLKKMGYQLMPLMQYYGDMQAITWDKKTGVLTAASDPRGIGQAAVVTTPVKGYGVKY